jgi:hypothetical protein
VRQALDSLDNLRRGSDAANGNGKAQNEAEIATIVEVGDGLTSQSPHSRLLSGSPPSGKLLIPLARRDVRVVVLLRGFAASAGHLAVARAGRRRERRRMKEHAWKLLWRFAMACYRFRLPLRSQLLNRDRVTSVDHGKPR